MSSKLTPAAEADRTAAGCRWRPTRTRPVWASQAGIGTPPPSVSPRPRSAVTYAGNKAWGWTARHPGARTRAHRFTPQPHRRFRSPLPLPSTHARIPCSGISSPSVRPGRPPPQPSCGFGTGSCRCRTSGRSSLSRPSLSALCLGGSAGMLRPGRRAGQRWAARPQDQFCLFRGGEEGGVKEADGSTGGRDPSFPSDRWEVTVRAGFAGAEVPFRLGLSPFRPHVWASRGKNSGGRGHTTVPR
jgi:hypothetical protein